MNRILTCLLCLSYVSVAADSQWHWIKVGDYVDHAWNVSKGDAEVSVKDGQFSAKLFSDGGSSKDIQISLKGSITNGRITVRAIERNSNVGSTYTGRLTSQKWKEAFEGMTGAETITLSDGLGMIGLTRLKQ